RELFADVPAFGDPRAFIQKPRGFGERCKIELDQSCSEITCAGECELVSLSRVAVAEEIAVSFCKNSETCAAYRCLRRFERDVARERVGRIEAGDDAQ